MPKKKTHDEFVNELNLISPDIEVLGRYAGRHSPVEVRCTICGKVWSPSAGDLLSGKGCRQCRIQAFAKGRTKSNEQFLQEISIINPNVEILTEYINSHTKITVKCKKCGNIWGITPKDLLRGYGCGICATKISAEKRKITEEVFIDRVRESNPSIAILGSYQSLQATIEVQCKVCGKIWFPKAHSILYGNGCPDCSKERVVAARRKTQEQFEKEIKQLLPSVTVLGTYKNIDTPVECRCEVCGFIWSPVPQSLYNGHGCKRCSRSGTSFMEQFIYHSFSEILGESQIVSRDRSAIGMELDIYIPSLNFAVEPGTWAFHKNSLKRDENKRGACQKKGIRLITVYDSFPQSQKAPFENDCIVFNGDYNASDHANIRKLILQLFEAVGVSADFSAEQWEKIENYAYRDARAKNTQDFAEELRLINENIEVLGTYIGSKIPIEVRCKKCDYVWSPKPNSLLNGTGCPVCSHERIVKKRTKTHEQFLAELEVIQPTVIVQGRYTKGKDHISVKCAVCGTEWEPVAASLLTGEGCPTCGLVKKTNGRRKTQEEFEKELYLVNPSLEVIGKYTGTNNPVCVHCKVCGYEWSRIARKLIDNPHHRGEKKLHQTVDAQDASK